MKNKNKGIRRKFYRSITSIMLVSFLLVTFIPIMVLCTYSYYYLAENVKEDFYNRSKQLVTGIDSNLTIYFNELKKLTDSVFVSETIEEILLTDGQSLSDSLEQYYGFQEYFSNLIGGRGDFACIYLYKQNGEYLEWNLRQMSHLQPSNEIVLEKLEESGARFVVFGPRTQTAASGYQRNIITVGRQLKSVNTGRDTGYLIIDLDYSAFQKIIGMKAKQPENLIISDADGRIYYNNHKWEDVGDIYPELETLLENEVSSNKKQYTEIKSNAPETFYWPASPSSGGGLDEPNAQDRGDVHYWDVWHGDKPITEYRKFYFRYVSEFGFQSFPTLKTIETFNKPKDRNIFSYVMEKHQRNQSANGKIMNYLGQTFLYPSDFGTLLYASQLLQAEAMRYGVEHFRRNRGRCMGTVIWQLNDCWPVASWSSIDYYGRWKALHYYEKRFFAPILLSCQEEGILTQDTNVNAQPYTVKKSIRLNVSNESRKERRVIVSWARRNAGGGILEEKSYPVTVPPMSAVWLEKVDMAHAALYEEYVSYELEEDGTSVSSGTVLFCAPKHFKFENPNLEVSVEDGYICVKADAYARSVEILNENEDLILEDNYFDMNGGRRRVKVLKGEVKGLKVRSVFDIG